MIRSGDEDARGVKFLVSESYGKTKKMGHKLLSGTLVADLDT